MTSPGLRSAWRTLRSEPDAILIPTAALSTCGLVVHVLVQYLLGVGVAGSHTCARLYLGQTLGADCGPTNARAQLTLTVALILLVTIGHLVVAGIYRAASDVDAGRPSRGALTVDRPVAVALTGALIGVGLTLGTILLALPALVLGFLTRYALLFVVEQGMSPVRAIRASAGFVMSDLAAEVRFTLAAIGVLLLGVLALGVGLYLAVPLVLLAQTQRYRARG